MHAKVLQFKVIGVDSISHLVLSRNSCFCILIIVGLLWGFTV